MRRLAYPCMNPRSREPVRRQGSAPRKAASQQRVEGERRLACALWGSLRGSQAWGRSSHGCTDQRQGSSFPFPLPRLVSTLKSSCFAAFRISCQARFDPWSSQRASLLVRCRVDSYLQDGTLNRAVWVLAATAHGRAVVPVSIESEPKVSPWSDHLAIAGPLQSAGRMKLLHQRPLCRSSASHQIVSCALSP